MYGSAKPAHSVSGRRTCVRNHGTITDSSGFLRRLHGSLRRNSGGAGAGKRLAGERRRTAGVGAAYHGGRPDGAALGDTQTSRRSHSPARGSHGTQTSVGTASGTTGLVRFCPALSLFCGAGLPATD